MQPISVRNQTLENLLASACLSELSLQLTAREEFRRRASELLKIQPANWRPRSGDPASRLPRHSSQLGRHRNSLCLHTSSHRASEVWDSEGTLTERVSSTVVGQTLQVSSTRIPGGSQEQHLNIRLSLNSRCLQEKILTCQLFFPCVSFL